MGDALEALLTVEGSRLTLTQNVGRVSHYPWDLLVYVEVQRGSSGLIVCVKQR